MNQEIWQFKVYGGQKSDQDCLAGRNITQTS